MREYSPFLRHIHRNQAAIDVQRIAPGIGLLLIGQLHGVAASRLDFV
jgi:hypothetical protein